MEAGERRDEEIRAQQKQVNGFAPPPLLLSTRINAAGEGHGGEAAEKKTVIAVSRRKGGVGAMWV